MTDSPIRRYGGGFAEKLVGAVPPPDRRSRAHRAVDDARWSGRREARLAPSGTMKDAPKPKSRPVAICLVSVFAALLLCSIAATSAKADHDSIEIVVTIEGDSAFCGEKIRHKVEWGKKNSQHVETGTTCIVPRTKKDDCEYECVLRLKSVRDDFNVYWLGKKELVVKGKTASAATLGMGPFINYEFHFIGGPTGAYLSGCHDGFPSYRVYSNKKLIYEYTHKGRNFLDLKFWKAFSKLAGRCDVKIGQGYTYPSLHTE